jgi:hypothetical protein
MAPTDQDTALPEASSKERSRPPSGSRSMVFAWGGVLAAGAALAALAVASFSADNDADVRGRRLAAQAEEYERQAHLEGQANTYGRNSGSANPTETGNRAAQSAEEYERQAHLEGQAKTYGDHSGVPRVTHASPSAWPTAGQAPTCSIWSVPTLEVAPVPQSNLTDGVPYVAVCIDADQETTFVFRYGQDNHTPAPRS